MDDQDMFRVAQGCQISFERIVLRHQERLINWLRGWDDNDAEDIAQEVFIRVLTNAQSYSPRREFEGWLYRIAKNLLIDRNRSARGQHPEVTFESDGDRDEFISQNAITLDTPASHAEHNDYVEAVNAAMVGVPQDQLDTLLCFAEGWSLPEIAQMSGVALSTTKSRLRLCREKLTERMSQSLS